MDKTQKMIISVLAVVLVAMIGLLVMLPAMVDSGTTVGQFNAPDHDPTAVSGVPQVEDSARQFGWLQMGDDIRLAMCGCPGLTQDGLELYVTSDSGNYAWLLVKVLDEAGNELGRSGLIRPGEYVQTVTLSETPAPGSTVTVKILTYEPETYYSLGSASAVVQIFALGD